MPEILSLPGKEALIIFSTKWEGEKKEWRRREVFYGKRKEGKKDLR